MDSHSTTIPTFVLFIIVFAFSFACAYDPSPVQDFCVANPKANVFVNGMACKDPKLVTVNDFSTSGLDKALKQEPSISGAMYSRASVAEIPGLNTLGLTMIRNEFQPGIVTQPHTHPRATEMVFLLQGNMYFGFVAVDPSDPTKNRIYAKEYKTGDVFVIPQGLVHFGQNIGNDTAITITVWNSQNPGFNYVPQQLFGNDTAIPDDLLAKSFRVDNDLDVKVITQIKSHF
ncbi:unnamed protein product [Cuscuta europaea]|uniref:Germin-like protein n=1 Tax=Cuscuta europaea TaxID=41803 RepID=A0A9P1E8T5_CUSEU|nr:unnamed protein product [Cuscuta europaea]